MQNDICSEANVKKPQYKVAFFDVDGTLLSFKTHALLPSTYTALDTLRAAGVRCILCTGRSPYSIQAIPQEKFDGLILFNGQLVIMNGQVVHRNALDPQDIKNVVEAVHQGSFECLFMQEDKWYLSAHDDLVRALEKEVNTYLKEEPIDQALTHPIIQLNAFIAPGDEYKILDITKHLKVTRWSPVFLDVVPLEGGKGNAVKAMLERLGIDPKDALAFGDGENDVDMFHEVGTSVAMGNAYAHVQAEASMVTSDANHDGIYNACRALGYPLKALDE